MSDNTTSILNLFTKHQQTALFANSKSKMPKEEQVPVAYLRIPQLGYSFLITQVDIDNPELAYGICNFDTDIKVQYFSLGAMKRTAFDAKDLLISDKEFYARYPLKVFAEVAKDIGTLIAYDDSPAFGALFKQHTPE